MRKPILLFALLVACGDDSSSSTTGNVDIQIEAEETITGGLDPGTDLESVRDGWTIRYDKFLYNMGNVHAASTASGDQLDEPAVHLVDLAALPAGGVTVGDFHDAPAVRFDVLSFDNPVVTASSVRESAVSEADMAMMMANHLAMYVEGSIDNPTGQSCNPAMPTGCMPATHLTFVWAVNAGTSYTACGPPEGDSGFAVPSGGTLAATFTIHGDHPWFNNFPEGVEVTERRAQWMANADLNHDMHVDMAELGMSMASDLFPSAMYSLSGSPIPINTGADWVLAQNHTIGHFQGEGECTPVVMP